MSEIGADESQFWQCFDEKCGQYEVRTKHFDGKGKPKFINALIKESSPYLLQHAHNPVSWQAWGEVAFAQAERENKPIFLSVGYATCHWCHVMEHESFEHIEVADYLNQHFICIKVDREQHPVVDDYYMTALQLIAGQGGWPLSAFIMADGKPFMAGTYYPQVAFLDLIKRIHHAFTGEQAVITEQAARIHRTVSRYLSGDTSDDLLDWEKETEQLTSELMAMADEKHGGFGAAPKFPQEAWLHFLLYRYLDTQDEAVGNHLYRSLKIMQTSGIHDVLAGGFHRYTVDEGWMVPHFEKMLYNQAQLLLLYAQASVVFADDGLAATARAIAQFVSHEMQGHNGLFYAGLDADSENEVGNSEEGAYYTWHWDEWTDILTEGELRFLQHHFDVYPEGNFEGKNILHGLDSLSTNDEWSSETWLSIKNKLIQARKGKKRPITDHKAILSWNAMMIESLAWSGQLLNDDGMKKMACIALDQLMCQHKKQGQWFRISVQGETSDVVAVLSDLANLAAALWAIHATGLKQVRESLEHLLTNIHSQFWRNGQLIQASEDKRLPPLVNAKDGATVSATAKLLSVLSVFDAEKWQAWRREILASLQATVRKQNTAHAGIFTAGLHQKNHMLGQNLHCKKGLKLSWQRATAACVLQIDALDNWQHKEMQITLDNDNVIHINHLPYELTVQPEIQSLAIEWVPCDERQCWPKQNSRLFLK